MADGLLDGVVCPRYDAAFLRKKTEIRQKPPPTSLSLSDSVSNLRLDFLLTLRIAGSHFLGGILLTGLAGRIATLGFQTLKHLVQRDCQTVAVTHGGVVSASRIELISHIGRDRERPRQDISVALFRWLGGLVIRRITTLSTHSSRPAVRPAYKYRQDHSLHSLPVIHTLPSYCHS